jgi:hypothetical protein
MYMTLPITSGTMMNFSFRQCKVNLENTVQECTRIAYKPLANSKDIEFKDLLIFPDCTYANTGGAENMIFLLVKEARKHNQESVIIGNNDTYLIKRLASENIPFRFVDQKTISNQAINANDEDLIILFHNWDGLQDLKRLPCRVVIWGILAKQIAGWNRFGFETKITGKKLLGDYFTKKLLIRLSALHGLISMDGATTDAIESFVGRSLNLPIIPIPVEPSNAMPATRPSPTGNSHAFSISYIGRSDDIWKIKPLKKVISDLAFVPNGRFKISIYTKESDPYLHELKSVLVPNISLSFHLGMYGEQLRLHLRNNSDLHISMGTAALEGALSGIPTILMDASFQDFPQQYKYRWLYESERCSLGRFVKSEETIFAGMTLPEAISACISDEKRDQIAEKCLQYTLQHHSLSKVAHMICNFSTKARMKDLVRYTPAIWKVAGLMRALRHTF